MSNLFRHFLLTLVPAVLCAPIDELLSLNKRDNFVWGSVGDSWASGVSYSPEVTDYDDDKNGCHRWKDSYGPIMEANTSWTINPQKFNFAACSGAQLVNIVALNQGDNPAQMTLVGNPQMITYHAGGNNCDFGRIIQDCVYQPGFLGYGPEYPDPAGDCAIRLAGSNGYINAEGGLYQDEINTVRDLLAHPSVKDNKDFKLYMLGYAQFFNLGVNYCDEISFGAFAPIGGRAPKVTNRLRTDINDGVQRVNDILARVANDVNDPRVKFIDISPAFNGHRFCENNHNYKDQWYNSDIWLWNLNIPAYDPPADPSLMDQWLSRNVLPDGSIFNAPDSATIGVEGSGGGSGNLWQQRPFHPKKGGTSAIANYVITNAIADGIPGVTRSHPAPPTTGTCNCNEDGCTSDSPACCANGSC